MPLCQAALGRKKSGRSLVLTVMASAHLTAPVYTGQLGLQARRAARRATRSRSAAAALAAAAFGLLALVGVAAALLLSRSPAQPSPQFLNAPVPTTSSPQADVSR
jgi:hypothetical protein